MDWWLEGYLDWKRGYDAAFAWELGLSKWNYWDRECYEEYLDGFFGWP